MTDSADITNNVDNPLDLDSGPRFDQYIFSQVTFCEAHNLRRHQEEALFVEEAMPALLNQRRPEKHKNVRQCKSGGNLSLRSMDRVMVSRWQPRGGSSEPT